MIHYKPYHYHLLLGLGYTLAFGAAIYLSLQPGASPVLFALWGYALRCVWYHQDQYAASRRSWRSVERIMEYAKESGE
jgi:hypothetical protein